MNRYARDRSQQPKMQKVEKVELSEQHILPRLIGVIVLVIIGALAFTYFFRTLVHTEKGWQTISTNTEELDCGQDFVLYYNLGTTGLSARAEKNGLTQAYSDACVNAYRWFTTDQTFDDVVTVYDLNHDPCNFFTVDPVLYHAFEILNSSGSRLLYYGPLYEVLENLYTCDTDAQARQLDPEYSSEMAQYFEEVLSYANDSNSIQLQLLGDNQVSLQISDDYLAYAADAGIERYIDFFAMKDAFIADYIAEALTDAGYTQGILSSYDGYTRVLDGGATETTFSLYDRMDSAVITAASVSAPGINAAVSLHAFPISEGESYRYFIYSDGSVRTPYLGMDGLSHCSCPNLVSVSSSKSCAEILMQVLPFYAEDAFDVSAVAVLQDAEIHTAYCSEEIIFSNIPDASFSDMYDKDGISYEITAAQ